MMRSRSGAGVPYGTRSSSCRLTPQAPISASRCTVWTGSRGGRVGSPKGSRPGLPTVHSPKVNLGSAIARFQQIRARGVRLGHDRPVARLIGLDVGTSSAKALAIDEAGRLLGEAERAYPVSMPHPGWSEQDPE